MAGEHALHLSGEVPRALLNWEITDLNWEITDLNWEITDLDISIHSGAPALSVSSAKTLDLLEEKRWEARRLVTAACDSDH